MAGVRGRSRAKNRTVRQHVISSEMNFFMGSYGRNVHRLGTGSQQQ